MPKLDPKSVKRLTGVLAALENDFTNWRPHFQELAQYVLPRRYIWLSERSPVATIGGNSEGGKSRASKKRNEKIIDATATLALRVLAAGMLNGVTSPTRPWLRLRKSGFSGEYDEMPLEHKQFFEEVARRMLLVMAESNFYNSLAITYLDLCCFGTASTLIYEDFAEIIRCYNSPIGEFRLAQDDRRVVDTFGRTFHMTLRQIEQRFGIENMNERHHAALKKGGQESHNSILVSHIIEPNTPDRPESLPERFAYREIYWETGDTSGMVLGIAGFQEKPGLWPRWELTANDTYGTSPAMDALPDIIQLQHMSLRKAQAMDKLVAPPVVMEQFMANNPGSILPGGMTVAPASASFGAKAVYQVNPPLGEMTADIQAMQIRIGEAFHNDLFRMISQLESVRSATEIDARREEKLIQLGAVLERFENEALDPGVRRIFNIMQRKNLLPPAPKDLEGEDIEIEYVSILSDAQRAVGTASIERFVQFVGEVSAVEPKVLQVPDIVELVRDYADRLSVPASGLKSRAQAEADIAAQEELVAARENALIGRDLTQAAQNLSGADVGGGINALQAITGG